MSAHPGAAVLPEVSVERADHPCAGSVRNPRRPFPGVLVFSGHPCCALNQQLSMYGPLRVLLGCDNLTIAHVNDAIGIAGGLGIVRDHEHSLSQVTIGLP